MPNDPTSGTATKTLGEAMCDYRGIHYPSPPWLGWPRWFYAAWRWLFCRRECHLWSEVASSGDEAWRHYLVCDACQLMLQIGRVETKYSEPFGISAPTSEDDDEPA